MRTIFWFRHDLRLDDNTGLHAACRRGAVVPCVCIDPFFFTNPAIGPNRLALFLRAVQSLSDDLETRGARLIVLHGKPEEELPALVKRSRADALFCNRDYEPYTLARDSRVEKALLEIGAAFQAFKDLVIFEHGEVLTLAGKPYTIYSQYLTRWQATEDRPAVLPLRKIEFPDDLRTLPSKPIDAGKFQPESDVPPISEKAARKLLREFLSDSIYSYSENRDLPAIEGTSRLSMHLKYGTIGPRTVVREAEALLKAARFPGQKKSLQTYISELIWRDFFFQIMAEFPRVIETAFRSEYASIQWETDARRLTAWKEGRTGFPIVDAGMRQLQATGWMHNRVRMITASFLCKDLLQNWLDGERHFARLLIDGEPAVNNGNWQWAASTGTDAQPYFRIFNPTTQSQRFDPTGAYIRKWVPELKSLGAEEIHEPSLSSKKTDYPHPIIEHAQQRARALELFKSAKVTK